MQTKVRKFKQAIPYKKLVCIGT